MRPSSPADPFNMAAYCLASRPRGAHTGPALIVLSDAASLHPAEVWSFGDLEAAVLRLGGALRASGLEPGARIVIRLDNTSLYAILFFAAVAAGFVPVPVSTLLTGEEVDFLLADSAAAAIAVAGHLPVGRVPSGVRVFAADEIAHMMQSGEPQGYAPTRADDPAFLIYTSGTTSRPKGVLHAHRAALGRRPMYRGWYGLRAEDRMLHAGAFNWTYTLGTGLTDPWANGASAIVYTGEKDPALWPRLIAQSGATLFAAVPGLVRQMLKYGRPQPGSLGNLRHALIAGETPPPGLFDEWEAATGRPLYEAIGMSEISTYISTGPDVPRKAGTLGKPQPGRRIAVLGVEGGTTPLPMGEEGLLAVHRADPGLMLGYWNRPEEEAEVMRGDWFVGGDLAAIDCDGYVTYLGRANDVMKALGYRVSPLEVEAALAAHPAVAEVACTEIRVREDVSVIGAFVVPRDAAAADADTLMAFVREKLAAYKCPREVRFVAALPRTANGKIRRAALRELASDSSGGH
ncbi:MAG: class I adenylate-forming enzyme family protein [Hyphomicrobium sp.]